MGSFKRALKRIDRHFVPSNLLDILDKDEVAFESFGKIEWMNDKDFYVFQDNGSSILGVAHLDTVHRGIPATMHTRGDGEKIVFSPTLDDRLGAWVLLDLLPRLGIKTDILLTVGEEMGMSTGADFVRHHKDNNWRPYRWMFQFDRAGTDVVSYDFECEELNRMLKSVGMRPATGTFSDIAMMDDIGCRGFNVGVGYRDNHSINSHAFLSDTFSQVARFMLFFDRYQKREMPYTPKHRYGTPWAVTPSHSVVVFNGRVYRYLEEARTYYHDPTTTPEDARHEKEFLDLYDDDQLDAGTTKDGEAGCYCGHTALLHSGTGCKYQGCYCLKYRDDSKPWEPDRPRYLPDARTMPMD